MAVEVFFEPARAAIGDLAFWKLPADDPMPQSNGSTVTRGLGVHTDEQGIERRMWWARVTQPGQALRFWPRAAYFVRGAAPMSGERRG